MGQPSKSQDKTPAQTNTLADVIARAEREAQNAPKRERAGTVVAGPFPVGELGEVCAVERTLGNSEKKFLYAEFERAGGGKRQSIPLAAVSTLAKELG